MENQQLLQDPNYDPNGFIDWLVKTLSLKNDAALSRRLETSPVLISKIRYRRIAPSAPMLISIHEETGLHIRDIKARMFRPAERDAA